ncbi:ComEA family DNA-binding protein [Flavobacterium luteum]|uniref:Helix-hairpin-helix domain-containing protein n=1 Tax=Flavobacterium luteum TaxID=2026654 RepID=A0A7J5AGR2_9FLAO|nr:helix-hairpin-helix domain-containing protein [Flavobacterium luteum]KAB1156578.1 helix-hairpin-helix domain-containing protein [Flavobacterium luteum]
MNLTTFKSYFKYTSSQRSGVFLLLLLIIVFQLVYFFVDFTSLKKNENNKEKLQWLSLQSQIDDAKQEKKEDIPKIYPFNPNFITDFKGYKLGMSTQEIDRLLEFRKSNKYVNSAKEFQAVTKVSDSLLNSISPFFKFPDWVINKKEFKSFSKQKFDKKEKIVVLDINQATKEDLKKVYGIGDGLSDRILKEKEKLGGFVTMDQMKDVWGLSPEVVLKLNEYFKIKIMPNIKKININSASIKELMQFSYFSKYQLAKSIVTYRSMNGEIKNTEDLTKIKDFPVEKVNTIVLYLEF